MSLDKQDFEALKVYVKALPRLSSMKKKFVIKTLDKLRHEFFEEARQSGFGAGVANLRKKRAKT
jgi:hypothetical protein